MYLMPKKTKYIDGMISVENELSTIRDISLKIMLRGRGQIFRKFFNLYNIIRKFSCQAFRNVSLFINIGTTKH